MWGEFTGHRWIPLTKPRDAELWCFLWCAHEQTAKQTIETLVILEQLRSLSRHCNVGYKEVWWVKDKRDPAIMWYFCVHSDRIMQFKHIFINIVIIYFLELIFLFWFKFHWNHWTTDYPINSHISTMKNSQYVNWLQWYIRLSCLGLLVYGDCSALDPDLLRKQQMARINRTKETLAIVWLYLVSDSVVVWCQNCYRYIFSLITLFNNPWNLSILHAL